jgi:MoxR-like ATPase
MDNRPAQPPPPTGDPAREAVQLGTRFQEAARVLGGSFLDKQEIIRLLLVSVIAGEHMLIVGPPGTAKSAIVRLFTRLIDGRYFEYLLTRFTEPNELFGPVDIKQFREGTYTRRTERMLPEAEIVFLDEIFKSNSAILNSLLTLLNERRFANGANVTKVPLISLFAASNEVPNDENLAAVFDRFLIRVVSDNLDSYHFHNLVQKGLANEVAQITGRAPVSGPVFRAEDLHRLHSGFDRWLTFSEDFLAKYKGLIFQIRSEGISVSDRRVVKLLKLFAASALFDGRAQAHDGDFFILKHIWNNLDQVELLEEIVNPVVDAYYRSRPEERRFLGPQAGLEELLAELKMIRELLTSGAQLSDIQLFSQLKNLNEIKAALQAIGNDTARRMLAEVDQLLETVFASSKFGG